MSDDEGKRSSGGYRLEYASSGRAKCKDESLKSCFNCYVLNVCFMACTAQALQWKRNRQGAWRHWGCVTSAIIKNAKKSFESPDELDGFEELKDSDKERIRTAWEEGKVADEDVPASAKNQDSNDEDEKPKKKKAPAKKKAHKDEDASDDEQKPKKKVSRKPAVKKAPSKQKKMQDSGSEGENFAKDMEDISESEGEDKVQAEVGKKRKRPVKKASTSSKPASKRSKKKKADDGNGDHE